MATNITLPPDLGIEHSRVLHAQLAPHLEAEAVTLSAPEVGRVHTATLQVLAAFVGTRARAGRATTWSQPSSLLSEGAARLGIDALLGLTPPAAASKEP